MNFSASYRNGGHLSPSCLKALETIDLGGVGEATLWKIHRLEHAGAIFIFVHFAIHEGLFFY